MPDWLLPRVTYIEQVPRLMPDCLLPLVTGLEQLPRLIPDWLLPRVTCLEPDDLSTILHSIDWQPYVGAALGFASGMFTICQVISHVEQRRRAGLENFERKVELKPKKSVGFVSNTLDVTYAIVPSMASIARRPSFLTNQPTSMDFSDLMNALLLKEEIVDDDFRKLSEAAEKATVTDRKAGDRLLQHHKGDWHALSRCSWKKVAVRIALLGEKDSGKTAFINAIRGGYREGDYMYAQENIRDPATRLLVYRHFENTSKVKYYEHPAGTLDLTPTVYFCDSQFQRVTTCFVVLQHYTPNIQKMAEHVFKTGKLAGFIRTKSNMDVRNKLESIKGDATADGILRLLKENCESEIMKASPQLAHLPVFMFDSHSVRDQMGDFDLADLKEYLVNLMKNEDKRAMILAMYKGDEALIKIKYHLLCETVGLATAIQTLTARNDSRFTDEIVHSLHLDDISAKSFSTKFELPLKEVQQMRDMCIQDCVTATANPRAAILALLSSLFSATGVTMAHVQGCVGTAVVYACSSCAAFCFLSALRSKRAQLRELLDMYGEAAEAYLHWLQNKYQKGRRPSFTFKQKRNSLLQNST